MRLNAHSIRRGYAAQEFDKLLISLSFVHFAFAILRGLC